MLKGKNILLGVTGSIAAYKSATLAHSLYKLGCNVDVVMTKNATEIIAPITFERLTLKKCITDTFYKSTQYDVKHISLAKKADMVIIAPATANIIGKIASGIADDMLTTTVMACKCPIYISPAMNTNMYENPIVQHNIEKLKSFGYKFIEPNEGLLACGDVGKGKMPEPEEIIEYVKRELASPKDLLGEKILITAGATMEAIDPVRYITNHSTGKMGCALAEAAMLRGAEVKLICGSISVEPPPFVKVINVKSAQDMFEAVRDNYKDCSCVIKSAAVADYTPIEKAENKIKKKASDMEIKLKKTVDILGFLGENKGDRILCGFSMETENLIENSQAKLVKKNLDIIAANNLKVKGAGFGTDTNVMTLITKDDVTSLPLMSKFQVANKILDKIKELKNNG